MAELFLKQGQTARALAIYRKIARERPGDPNVARRLAEIEAGLVSQPGGPMSFQEHIRRIVDNVPGAMAGVIMGFDGIAIDTYEKPGSESDRDFLNALLTEYSSAAQQMRRAAESLELPGEIQEVVVAGEKLTAVMRPLTTDIFLGVVLGAEGLTSKARYLMRVVGPALAKELA